MQFLLRDTSHKLVPREIQFLFETDKYKHEFKSFKKNYDGDFCDFSKNLVAFKNAYAKNNLLLKTNEINVEPDFFKYFKSKCNPEVYMNFGSTVFTKDDFSKGFDIRVWNNMNIKQKYTVLNWLQESVSKNRPLPDINLIPDDQNGGYNFKTKCLNLNSLNAYTGLEAAGSLIFQMSHFDEQCKQGFTCINTKQKDRNTIDKSLDDLSRAARKELLYKKNLLQYLYPTDMQVCNLNDINNFNSFKRYIDTELYLHSPLVQIGHEKRACEMQKILQSIAQSEIKNPLDKDIATVQMSEKFAKNLKSGVFNPMLSRLGDNTATRLLDNSFKINYYQNENLKLEPEYKHYVTEKNDILRNYYMRVMDINGRVL